MEDFEFYKKIRIDKKLHEISSELHSIYNSMPDTVGCMEHTQKKNGCGGWCCKVQSPQLLYSEFLNIWRYVLNKWDSEEIYDIIERSLKNYVMGDVTKGCVFMDPKTNLCLIHKKRAYNCRIYGITPEEEFKPRYKRLKEIYKDNPAIIIKDQCNLIKTSNGEEVTIEDTDRWWNRLVKIEKKLGIPSKNINDKSGGSYRAPHDHVLLYMLPDNVLRQLQKIRLSNDVEEKNFAIKNYMSVVRGKNG